MARMIEEGEEIDSCVTDPPYHLTSIVKRFGDENARPARKGKKRNATGAYARASAGFLGKEWDGGDIAFRPETWRLVWELLPPGGHLLAFSATRTYHRMTTAIEDAGFEIRDMIAWMYGTGFPKSHDVSKGIDKRFGNERAVTDSGKPVRRIRPGADQVRDGTWKKLEDRFVTSFETLPGSDDAQEWEGWGTALKPALEPLVVARKPLIGSVAENVLAHGTGALNIDACRVPGQCFEMEYFDSVATSGYSGGLEGGKRTGRVLEGRWPANVIHDGSDDVVRAFPAAGGAQGAVKPDTGTGNKTNGIFGPFAANSDHKPRGDTGSAARFFYSAKADAGDRLNTDHPTVKPVDLIAYLCRLVTPPGGTVLDPFAGSGTAGRAALREGFNAVLIEREESYLRDIRRGLDHVSGADTPLFGDSE